MLFKTNHTDLTPRENTQKGKTTAEEFPSEKLDCFNQNYKMILDAVNDAILVADIQSGIIIDANKKVEDLFGIPREEIIGMHQFQLHPPEKISFYMEKFKEAAALGTQITEKMYIVNKENEYIPVEISAKVSEFQGNDALIGVFRDIRSRLLLEDKLYNSEKLFNSISTATGDMIHLNDLSGNLIYVNTVTESLLGYSQDEIIGKSVKDFIHPNDAKDIGQDIARLLETQKNPPARDIRLLHKNGSTLHVNVKGFLVEARGKKYIGAILRPIDEQLKMNEKIKYYQLNLESLVQKRTISLEKTLSEVQTLNGILPICSHCKKIRDENGYWEQLEMYIRERSKAEFTHCICPDCAKKHYSQLSLEDLDFNT